MSEERDLEYWVNRIIVQCDLIDKQIQSINLDLKEMLKTENTISVSESAFIRPLVCPIFDDADLSDNEKYGVDYNVDKIMG